MNKTIFVDRDDTICPDRKYLDNVEGLELLEGAGEGLRRMKELGYKIALITNQSGIGRGYFPESMVYKQHARLEELLSEYDVGFDTIRHCPHTPDDGCGCRKPQPGMLVAAGRELDTDFSSSWMIGNSEADVEAGHAVGCQSIQVGEDLNLTGAAEIIAEYESKHGS
ncbi:MAG: HAD family hydrolase [Deltaproteobacteria bacterium]|nr:HAD family hydrolase [Deltaproteobacteria bacterium]